MGTMPKNCKKCGIFFDRGCSIVIGQITQSNAALKAKVRFTTDQARWTAEQPVSIIPRRPLLRILILIQVLQCKQWMDLAVALMSLAGRLFRSYLRQVRIQ